MRLIQDLLSTAIVGFLVLGCGTTSEESSTGRIPSAIAGGDGGIPPPPPPDAGAAPDAGPPDAGAAPDGGPPDAGGHPYDEVEEDMEDGDPDGGHEDDYPSEPSEVTTDPHTHWCKAYKNEWSFLSGWHWVLRQEFTGSWPQVRQDCIAYLNTFTAQYNCSHYKSCDCCDRRSYGPGGRTCRGNPP